MRRKLLLWLAPWLTLVLGACGTMPRPAPSASSKACAEWLWIGIRSPQAEECPRIQGWKVSPMFPLPSAAPVKEGYYGQEKGLAAPAPEVIRELERFCVYEKRPGQVAFVPTVNDNLVRVDQDCAALSRSGGAATAGTASWQELSAHFLRQAGKPETPLVIRNRLGVRLAFLDTHRTGEGAPKAPPHGEGTSEHGYTLAHIARHLVCSPATGEACAAQIATRLALPIVRFDPKSQRRTVISENGGHIGLQSHLADAIFQEVNHWRTLRNPPEQQHLVLNLSVAWDGELFSGLREEQVAEMRAGTQAVYRALQYAAGFDVLVLAAAGNQRDCPGENTGPLLPAAWETGGPKDASCRAEKQLVYAVGGVNSEGKPLTNARELGMPRRVAYGENGVVPALVPGESTNIYTGSSVATAVASSIAAIAWDTAPGLEPGELMRKLDASGDRISQPASFWHGSDTASGGGPLIRRLSLCTALSAICNPGTANCPLQTECEEWVAARSRFQDQAANSVSRACHPWNVPQPDDYPCPNCNPPRLDQ